MRAGAHALEAEARVKADILWRGFGMEKEGLAETVLSRSLFTWVGYQLARAAN